jgi:hypothetical protein
MKNRMAVGVLLFAVIGLTPQSVHAVDYRFNATLAAYQWKEHTTETPKESGPVILLGGFVSGSPSKALPSLTLRGDMSLWLGRVKYDTVTIGPPTTPVSTHTAYLGLTEEGSIGWRVSGPGGRVEPFLGVASRWWVRNIETTGNVQGYPETYWTIVGRLGVRMQQAATKGWGLYGVVSADPMLWAREGIDLSNSTGEGLFVRNGSKVGWTLEAGFRRRESDIGLFWQAVRLGESNLVACSFGGCLQPKSDQDILGVKVGVTF